MDAKTKMDVETSAIPSAKRGTEIEEAEESAEVSREEVDQSEHFHHRRLSLAALDDAERLLSSAGGECAALWTRAGRILRLIAPATHDDNRPEVRLQAYKQR